MKLSSKKILYIGATVCGAICITLVLAHFFGARYTLRSQCMPGSGMDCACFTNVIDHRLNKQEARIFAKFTKELRIRPHANILEFTDEATARNILSAFAICRPVPQPQQENQIKKGKK